MTIWVQFFIWGSMIVAAAILLYYNRKIRRKLREAGATSPENAKTIKELGMTGIEKRSLARLKLAGKVEEIVDDMDEKRYYLR